MVRAQDRLSPHGVVYGSLGEATFARGLFRLLPEDIFDHQPVMAVSGNMIVAADARIDNRADLLRRLGSPSTARIGDGELACRIFLSENERAFDLIRGDFALAAWDERGRTLTLARDVTGQRPLHYHTAGHRAAFSTMPHGLLALSIHAPCIDKRQLAQFVADIPRSGDRTFFETIRRVEPGHVVRLSAAGVSTRRYWSPPRQRLVLKRDEDYVEAARECLNLALRRRLRGAEANVGAQLSAGLDSGGVAATAALEMLGQGGIVTAFTSAPGATFGGPVPRGRIADESHLARMVADRHVNMEHVIVRAERASPLEIIKRDSGLFGEPLGLPCNQVWWAAINDAAQSRGLNVMLTGEAGNYGFSSGGAGTLHDFVRDGRLVRAILEGISLRRQGLRWRGIGYAAAAPWIPRPIWAGIQRIHWGVPTTSEGVGLLSATARALLPFDSQAVARSSRPRGDRISWQTELLEGADPGVFRKGTLARWHIDERDPTADRDLLEFGFSLPTDQLMRGGITRRMARRALADRLPPEIISGPRGYQGADWYERVSVEDALELIEVLRDHSEGNDVVDLTRLASLARRWPTQGWAQGSIISCFRYGFLRALSAACFSHQFESGLALSALRH